MRPRMSMSGKLELMGVTRERYRRAERREKTKILDELVASTGLKRKYAITAAPRPALRAAYSHWASLGSSA